MRILHATDTYGPTVGGIEVLVRDLAARQAAAGHDVTVLTRTPGPAARSAAPVMVLRDPGRLTDLVRRADLVHAHVSAYSPLALRAAESAASRGVPVVAAVHSMWGNAWPLVRAVAGARGWLTLPIQWAAVSEAAAEPVRRALPGRSVTVLPNAVDVAAWSPQARSAVTGPITMVSVLRMTRRKRPLAMVEALARVRRELAADTPVRAVLVGDGPQRAAVVRAVSRHGLDSWVSVPGAMDHDHIKALYRTADVFISPATLESFGIAALEARASGLAVVSRAGTGVSDFVAHEQDGLVAGTDDELAAAIVRLCTDRLLLARLKAHNASHPPAFDWSDVLWRNAYAYEQAALLAHGPAESTRSQVLLSGLRPESAA